MLGGCAIAVACALAMPAITQAETLSNSSSDPIAILDNQVAAPYPAGLSFFGADGSITDVDVTLFFSHTRPDDLDIMVVSPGGSAVRLMVDACDGADIVNKSITFDDAAPTELPANNCTSGSFRPTTPGSATFPAPAPGGSGFELNEFNGDNPNGRWQLFVVDDFGGETGGIASWSVSVTTQPAEIAIPAGPGSSGVASQYPATQSVPTPDGHVIADVDLLIPDFNHSFPGDIDMLLQGPGGQSVVLMSDACSDGDLTTRQIQFTDEDGTALTNENSNACKFNFLSIPADFGDPPEDLPAPAPPRPYAGSLAAFDGLQADEWRLWISDDANGDTGYLNGWGPVLTTRLAASTGFTAPEVSTAEGQTATLTVTRTGPVDLGPATLDVTVNHGDTDASDIGTVPAKLQFARGETSKTIDIPITAERVGEESENFTVALSLAVNDALLADATSLATVRIAKSDSDNRFTIGKAKRLRNGSARLEVTIPNPGTITTLDAGPKELLKESTVDVERPGTTTVKVKPASKAKRKLRRGKKVKVTTEVIYTPYDGSANSAEALVKLKKKD